MNCLRCGCSHEIHKHFHDRTYCGNCGELCRAFIPDTGWGKFWFRVLKIQKVTPPEETGWPYAGSFALPSDNHRE